MNKHHIDVTKTARYFTLGQLSENTKEVWWVFHGYGQSAEYFIKHFEMLDDGKTYVIAPEGLSKFYLDGVAGRVGATWMTKVDREAEISDYLGYLNKLYKREMGEINPERVQINFLAFSQGTATAGRWIAYSDIPVKNFVLWAGRFPHDVNVEKYGKRFREIPLWLVYGKDDQYLEHIDVKNYEEFMRQNKFQYEIVPFNGKHEMNKTVLKDLKKRFQSR